MNRHQICLQSHCNAELELEEGTLLQRTREREGNDSESLTLRLSRRTLHPALE